MTTKAQPKLDVPTLEYILSVLETETEAYREGSYKAGAKTYRIWHAWGIVANRKFSTAYGAYMKAGERALAKYWERHRSMMEVA